MCCDLLCALYCSLPIPRLLMYEKETRGNKLTSAKLIHLVFLCHLWHNFWSLNNILVIHARLSCEIDIRTLLMWFWQFFFSPYFWPAFRDQKIQFTVLQRQDMQCTVMMGQKIHCAILMRQKKVTCELFMPVCGLPVKTSSPLTTTVMILQYANSLWIAVSSFLFSLGSPKFALGFLGFPLSWCLWLILKTY